MNDAKYIGLDVHQATISVTVREKGLGYWARNSRRDLRNIRC